MSSLSDPYKPKYIQLFEKLKQDIITGNLKSGDRIYSENELRKMYGVSSTTVRKAIDTLRNSGFITRIQGVGTFVREHHVQRSLEKILSFTKNMQQAGLKPSTKVLEKKIIPATGIYAEKLGVEEGEKIFLLRRLRFGNETPMLLETRYINLKLCYDIIDLDLTGSLYNIYEERYGVRLFRAEQHLQIAFLNKKEAKLLKCKPNSPCFLVTGVTYSEKNEPVEYEESLYRGDEYEFFVKVGG
jgi:GntR family transcriptional regulator